MTDEIEYLQSELAHESGRPLTFCIQALGPHGLHVYADASYGFGDFLYAFAFEAGQRIGELERRVTSLEEQCRWLENDLRSTGPGKPVEHTKCHGARGRKRKTERPTAGFGVGRN